MVAQLSPNQSAKVPKKWAFTRTWAFIGENTVMEDMKYHDSTLLICYIFVLTQYVLQKTQLKIISLDGLVI